VSTEDDLRSRCDEPNDRTGEPLVMHASPAFEPSGEDLAFLDVYGDWDPLTPTELGHLMGGFPDPWWVAGGYAVEAFTGVARRHEDIDMVVFSDSVPALRAHLGETFHLWSNHGGTFRIIDDVHPEPLHQSSQIWMRRDARSPWRLDCLLNPSVDGRWQSTRDRGFVADLDAVTWVAGDGVRDLNPEVALLFKAKQHRAKDEIDLESAWPLLTVQLRSWLRDAVLRLHPDHPWQHRLDPHRARKEARAESTEGTVGP
jgi:hypothetical protein